MSPSRDEVLRIQRSFRAVLAAMSRPGVVTKMPLPLAGAVRYPGVSAPLATLIDMFVDQATTFFLAAGCADDASGDGANSCADGAGGATEAGYANDAGGRDSEGALSMAIAAETHAQPAKLDTAAFVVVPRATCGAGIGEAVARACGGTFESPETGATVFIECGAIAKSGEAPANVHWVSVEGPGVKDAHAFGTDRVDWVWARNRREDEFPCGIDIVFVDPCGRVVAVPRTSFVSLLAGKE